MIRFVIAQYGVDDWRLVKWDGSEESEIGNGWVDKPDYADMAGEIIAHHGQTNLDAGLKDVAVLTSKNVPVRNMMITDETLPWSD